MANKTVRVVFAVDIHPLICLNGLDESRVVVDSIKEAVLRVVLHYKECAKDGILWGYTFFNSRASSAAPNRRTFSELSSDTFDVFSQQLDLHVPQIGGEWPDYAHGEAEEQSAAEVVGRTLAHLLTDFTWNRVELVDAMSPVKKGRASKTAPPRQPKNFVFLLAPCPSNLVQLCSFSLNSRSREQVRRGDAEKAWQFSLRGLEGAFQSPRGLTTQYAEQHISVYWLDTARSLLAVLPDDGQAIEDCSVDGRSSDAEHQHEVSPADARGGEAQASSGVHATTAVEDEDAGWRGFSPGLSPSSLRRHLVHAVGGALHLSFKPSWAKDPFSQDAVPEAMAKVLSLFGGNVVPTETLLFFDSVPFASSVGPLLERQENTVLGGLSDDVDLGPSAPWTGGATACWKGKLGFSAVFKRKKTSFQDAFFVSLSPLLAGARAGVFEEAADNAAHVPASAWPAGLRSSLACKVASPSIAIVAVITHGALDSSCNTPHQAFFATVCPPADEGEDARLEQQSLFSTLMRVLAREEFCLICAVVYPGSSNVLPLVLRPYSLVAATVHVVQSDFLHDACVVSDSAFSSSCGERLAAYTEAPRTEHMFAHLATLVPPADIPPFPASEDSLRPLYSAISQQMDGALDLRHRPPVSCLCSRRSKSSLSAHFVGSLRTWMASALTRESIDAADRIAIADTRAILEERYKAKLYMMALEDRTLKDRSAQETAMVAMSSPAEQPGTGPERAQRSLDALRATYGEMLEGPFPPMASSNYSELAEFFDSTLRKTCTEVAAALDTDGIAEVRAMIESELIKMPNKLKKLYAKGDSTEDMQLRIARKVRAFQLQIGLRFEVECMKARLGPYKGGATARPQKVDPISKKACLALSDLLGGISLHLQGPDGNGCLQYMELYLVARYGALLPMTLLSLYDDFSATVPPMLAQYTASPSPVKAIAKRQNHLPAPQPLRMRALLGAGETPKHGTLSKTLVGAKTKEKEKEKKPKFESLPKDILGHFTQKMGNMEILFREVQYRKTKPKKRGATKSSGPMGKPSHPTSKGAKYRAKGGAAKTKTSAPPAVGAKPKISARAAKNHKGNADGGKDNTDKDSDHDGEDKDSEREKRAQRRLFERDQGRLTLTSEADIFQCPPPLSPPAPVHGPTRPRPRPNLPSSPSTAKGRTAGSTSAALVAAPARQVLARRGALIMEEANKFIGGTAGVDGAAVVLESPVRRSRRATRMGSVVQETPTRGRPRPVPMTSSPVKVIMDTPVRKKRKAERQKDDDEPKLKRRRTFVAPQLN